MRLLLHGRRVCKDKAQGRQLVCVMFWCWCWLLPELIIFRAWAYMIGVRACWLGQQVDICQSEMGWLNVQWLARRKGEVGGLLVAAIFECHLD
jgi:hypothetical protein